MSRPKPTPRYSERIAAPRSAHEPGRDNVIPLHGHTPASSAEAISPARPARSHAPLDQRPWRVLLVPPTPRSRTRGFAIARWQARAILALVTALVVTTLAAGAALVAAVRTPDFFATAGEMAALRAQLALAVDSLAVVRAASSDIIAPSAAGDGAPSVRYGNDRPPSRRRGSFAGAPLRIDGLPVFGRIASRFSHARRHPLLRITRPHLGVDVSAPTGTRISAPAAGQVQFVGRRFAYGLVVEVNHGRGVVTRYAHCRAALVQRGDRVAMGAAIATVGSSGLTSGPHLHYEVLVNGRPVDPLRYHFAAAQPRGDTAIAPPAPSTGVGRESTSAVLRDIASP